MEVWGQLFNHIDLKPLLLSNHIGPSSNRGCSYVCVKGMRVKKPYFDSLKILCALRVKNRKKGLATINSWVFLYEILYNFFGGGLGWERVSGDAPPAALRFSVDFRSVRLLRRVPVYGHTSQGQTRTKPYVNRISTAPERSCQNEAIFELFSGDFATEFLECFSALKKRPFET